MSYTAEVYQVMLTSPSDVKDEKEKAREVIHEWNSLNSKKEGILLFPVDWEKDVSRDFSKKPQENISKTILFDSDLLIAIFGSRIGTKTKDHESYSVEEIEEHISSNKPAMLFFSDAPIPRSERGSEQLDRLEAFRKKCFERGLVESYVDVESFEDNFRKGLAQLVNQSDHFIPLDNGGSNFLFESPQLDEKSVSESLGEKEKTLLLNASGDDGGIVFLMEWMGGWAIQVGDEVLNQVETTRAKAEWKEALDNLINLELFEELFGGNSERYMITNKGFKVSDILRA